MSSPFAPDTYVHVSRRFSGVDDPIAGALTYGEARAYPRHLVRSDRPAELLMQLLAAAGVDDDAIQRCRPLVGEFLTALRSELRETATEAADKAVEEHHTSHHD